MRKRIIKDVRYKVSLEFDYIVKELEKWSSESIPVLLDRILKQFLEVDEMFFRDKLNEYENQQFTQVLKQLELSHKLMDKN
jgi:hypothetical protein